jgi:hypothetical protein
VQLGRTLADHHLGGGGHIQRAEADGVESGDGGRLLFPSAGDDHERAVGQAPDRPPEPGCGGGTGQMEVIDDDHERSALGLAAHDAAYGGEQQGAPCGGVCQDGQLGRGQGLALYAQERAPDRGVSPEHPGVGVHEVGVRSESGGAGGRYRLDRLAAPAADQFKNGVEQRLEW